jgi:hypothetical protein
VVLAQPEADPVTLCRLPYRWILPFHLYDPAHKITDRARHIDEIQAVLDDYLEGYNTKRPHQGRGMNGCSPIRAFTEGMPKASNTEVTSQTKTAKL